jgi:hypothetical protein
MSKVIRSTGQIEPLKWGIPVPELAEAINNLAQKHECDPVQLAATAMVAAFVHEPRPRAYGNAGLRCVCL